MTNPDFDPGAADRAAVPRFSRGDILYRDEYFVAVHKPSGLLVHRTELARENDALLQRLRRSIRRKVFPVHRLDRATSGVIVFGLSSEAARRLGRSFSNRSVEKTYWTVVRGYTEESGTIDRPLGDSRESPKRDAVTVYRRIATVELPIPVGPYPGARYSWVEARPRTGRMHQIRKHFARTAHPVVGDTTYGDGEHNRLFRKHFGVHRLLLISRAVAFEHPFTGMRLVIRACLEPEIKRLFEKLGWSGKDAFREA
jgi:tRNA pseudouridine65 synthase